MNGIIRNIAQSYCGMKPEDKGCKTWSEMQQKMADEIEVAIKTEVLNKKEGDDLRYKVESDKALIYDSKTDKDICVYFDDETRDWLLNILNTII